MVLAAALGPRSRPRVEHLDLSNNRVAQDGAAALALAIVPDPSAGEDSGELRLLDLGGNFLIGDGPAFGAALEEALRTNRVLSSLILAGCHIGDVVAAAAGRGLRDGAASALQRLDIRHNSIGPLGAAGLAAGLRGGGLKRLLLDNNAVRSEGAAAIADAIAGGTGAHSSLETHRDVVPADTGRRCRLQELGLGANGVGDDGASSLSAALAAAPSPSLRCLALPANEISDIGARALGEALVSAAAVRLNDSSGLAELDLGTNFISDDGAAAIAEAAAVSPALTTLALNRNMVSDAGASAIAAALSRGSRLERVDLSDNQIGPAGAVALGEALAGNQFLTRLELRNNVIGDDGAAAAALGHGLAENSKLHTIYLFANQLGDIVAAGLGRALGTSGLVGLHLWGNDIGDDGAAELAAGLKLNSRLKLLDLGGNHIGDAGAAAIGVALKNTKPRDGDGATAARGAMVLETLDLSGNQIGDAGAEALAAGLAANRGLRSLDLTNNKIGRAGAAALARAIEGSGCTLRNLEIRWNRVGDHNTIAGELRSIGMSVSDGERIRRALRPAKNEL